MMLPYLITLVVCKLLLGQVLGFVPHHHSRTVGELGRKEAMQPPRVLVNYQRGMQHDPPPPKTSPMINRAIAAYCAACTSISLFGA